MCIVDDAYDLILRRNDIITSSCRAAYNAQAPKPFMVILSKTHSCSTYREQVICIELPYHPEMDFLVVHCHDKAGERIFQDLSFKVSHSTQAVIIFFRCGILQHDHTSLIVQVRNSKCRTCKAVEECFFYFDIFIKSFVVIQVIMCDIAEKASCKMEAGNTMLMHCMRAHFHKHVGTCCLYHLCYQFIY